ncbi:hypothetical protein [Actinomadura sp. HBU206391]|uniref:hypothetical protein n=1 Tax=Actinomadura sp. HBU206391 TaxID=2731692 RepID=UPI00164F0880|nr:hypothetical protein [Actinomadura sp. HBU206391]MBC6461832.1 hypothetical protein [Actinomadura sp. HBU206391]
MARTRPDSGAISLSGLLNFCAVIFLVCALFLFIDVRHRMTGYRAVHGQGIQGTVTVTDCGSHLINTYCTGDFTSADGRVSRSEIRVNGGPELLGETGAHGGPTVPVHLPAVLSDADADEAWTLQGNPWMRLGKAQVLALVPVAAPVVVLWILLRGGAGNRRQRIDRVRLIQSRRTHRREIAHLRKIRRGRIS